MVGCIHRLKGRARFKAEGLRGSEALAYFLEKNLSESPLVKRASASALTGNVLVTFKEKVSISQISSIIEKNLSEFNKASEKEAQQGDRLFSDQQMTRNGDGFLHSLKRLFESAENRIKGSGKQEAKSWHTMDADSVLDFHGSSRESGLSHAAAEEKLQKHGLNTLPAPVPRSGFWLVLEQMNSMPIASLGLAAGISLLTGGIGDAAVSVAVVLINSGIGYAAEKKAEETICELRSADDTRIQVIRSGELEEIASDQVMLGDIMVLEPGTDVPADGRVIEANQLSVDESELTGESMPVIKTAESSGNEDLPLADRCNMVYRGTLVTGGSGMAVAVATGTFTELGKLQNLFGASLPPQPAIAAQLNKVGRMSLFMGTAACGSVMLSALIRGYSLIGFTQTSLSLIAAAIPEGLATLAISALALNIRHMQTNHIFVRHLRAVGNLGSIQTVCFDKTGTLTLNRMTVLKIQTGVKLIDVVEDQLQIEGDSGDSLSLQEVAWLLRITALCNETEIENDDGITLTGSATETAMVRLAIRSGVDIDALRSEYALLQTKQRSAESPFMTTIHRFNDSGRLVAVKGSPLEVLERCSWIMLDGERVPLREQEKNRIELQNERLSAEALRVLGVAYSSSENEVLGDDGDAVKGLTWLGLLGMADPLRDGAKELIATFHQAGIKTRIITGDQTNTAQAIGRQLNLSGNAPLEILDSIQLESLDPDVLASLVKRAHIFARVSHTQKLHIIQAYQNTGEVVAMAGDGVNDAPALKVADVGISLGLSGTELAKEAADIILEDDDLTRMITMIEDGRNIFDNIKKSVRFLLTTNLSEIFTRLAATATGLGGSVTGLQSICTNLLCVTLSLESAEPELLKAAPRTRGEPLLGAADFRRMARESVAIAGGAIGAGGYGLIKYGAGLRTGTMAFQSLALGQILHASTCRSRAGGNGNNNKVPLNPYLEATLFGSLALQLISMFVPAARGLLGLAPISALDGLVVGAGALLPFFFNQGKIFGSQPYGMPPYQYPSSSRVQ